ncbi:MAG: serine hydrolase [Acidobacteria bacterium]|nr:serine hydrolase [Acidobacteriota bacterium]
MSDTVLYGASFTKSAFAYMVLDRPVRAYLAKPWAEYEKWKELGEDPRSRLITARTLLNHTSGFANYRFFNPGEKLQMCFAPGERYAYSGEGINLLGFVVEQVTGLGVAELMRKRVFDRFGMKRSSMVWREDFAGNLAVGHDEQGKGLGHSKRISARAAGSMDTTITDVALFLRGVMRGKGMSRATKAEMLRTQIRIRSRAQFPTLNQLEVDAYDGIRLGYALGWGVFESPFGPAFFKEGHDDGWEHHLVCFAAKESCIVLMTNSSNGDEVFMDLRGELMADRSTRWRGEGYAPPTPGTGAPR